MHTYELATGTGIFRQKNFSKPFGSSPQKGKVDLCTTNGSKVMIYLTLLNFLLHNTYKITVKYEILVIKTFGLGSRTRDVCS